MGGARLGQQSSVAVTILTNDDAHGLIGFADVSFCLTISFLPAPEYDVFIISPFFLKGFLISGYI